MLDFKGLSLSDKKNDKVTYCIAPIFIGTSLKAGFAKSMASLFTDIAIAAVVVTQVEMLLRPMRFLLSEVYMPKLKRLNSKATVLKYLSNILPPEVFICVNFG